MRRVIHFSLGLRSKTSGASLAPPEVHPPPLLTPDVSLGILARVQRRDKEHTHTHTGYKTEWDVCDLVNNGVGQILLDGLDRQHETQGRQVFVQALNFKALK